MIKEHDIVRAKVLMGNIIVNMVGTVVHIYKNEQICDIEVKSATLGSIIETVPLIDVVKI